jgi:uncharacterized protein (TIGR00299 family) protein
MQTLYLDLFSGLSGDMFVGALLDLGADFAALERGLATLGVGGYHLHATRRLKAGISGTKFDVHLAGDAGPAPAAGTPSGPGLESPPHAHPHLHLLPHLHAHGPAHSHGHGHGHAHPPPVVPAPAHPHPPGAGPEPAQGHAHAHSRDFAAIQALIAASPLSAWVKEKATAVFRRVAEAEGRIHGQPPERVHFHEVGAVDSIVDIVGGCLALELLGRPRVLASAVVEGTGWVRCAHGRFPVPTPATVEILAARGVTLTQCAEPHELVTPTGAALLAELAESFGPLADFQLGRVGYGLGTRDHQSRPNVLRALLGTSLAVPAAHAHDWETDTVVVLETNLDDLNPEVLGHFTELALAAGALDVFHTPVLMKKGRPATLLTVLCPPGDADRFSALLLTETSAFGVRRTVAERRKLQRDFAPVTTPFGEVTVKRGRLDGRVVQAAPEYESCRRVAAAAGVPLPNVYAAAITAAAALRD